VLVQKLVQKLVLGHADAVRSKSFVAKFRYVASKPTVAFRPSTEGKLSSESVAAMKFSFWSPKHFTED
jgi:hypothetical protein